MNILLLDKSDFISDDTAVISDRRFTQLKEVIRASGGKICKAGVVGGSRGDGEIIEINDQCARILFTPVSAPPPAAPVRLVAALPRPKSFSKVLHAAVSMGVKKLCFINSFKVDKSYWRSPRLRSENVNQEILLALEQAGDTILPQVEFHSLFKPFVEDVLPQFAAGTLKLLGDPSGTPLTHSGGGEVTLAVGPEGGFTDYETQMLISAGFAPVSLSPRPLRTEFAVAALLSRLI